MASGLVGAGFLIAGCRSDAIRPETGLIEQSPPYLYSDIDWADVLERHVRDGLVNYGELQRNPEPLKRYYALLSRTGPSLSPDQFTSRQQVTAYWINAYNALVLMAVLRNYPISTIHDLSLPSLDHGYKFDVDGQVRDLKAIENQALAESGNDVRVLFVLCGAAVGTPKLLSQPLRAGTLDRQLSDAAAAALDDPAILQIDRSSHSILVWQGIFNRQELFLEYWRSRRRVSAGFFYNVLLDLASMSQRQALQSAVGYPLRQMPFDRTLNDLAAPATTSAPQ
jgi:hypothetical protein